jgi:hypothetical protein
MSFLYRFLNFGLIFLERTAPELGLVDFLQIGRLSMNKQLEYFANTKAQIIGLVGEAAGMELLNKANDYVNNYYQPLSPIANLTSTQVADLLVTTYKEQLTVHP